MKYSDKIYGELEITEPVILELIGSKSIQRLKGIDQAGYSPLWVKPETGAGHNEYNRFTHSVGVFLLLKKYSAPLEEQISGLIHDVSHSAFSHCIDYVLEDGSEKEHDCQDNIFKDFVSKTEIPQILKKFSFNPDYIIDDAHFPLKEKNLPDLCADRIDYSLRGAVIFGEIGDSEKKYFLDNLIVMNNNWVFKNFESCKKFAELFSKLNRVYYASLQSAIMFRTVGDYLRHSLKKGYISKNDLYTTDKKILSMIKKFLDRDEKLNLLFRRMNNKTKIINDPDNYDASIFCKSRAVDPLFIDGSELKRVSKVDSGWNDLVKKESEPKQYFLKFID